MWQYYDHVIWVGNDDLYKNSNSWTNTKLIVSKLQLFFFLLQSLNRKNQNSREI